MKIVKLFLIALVTISFAACSAGMNFGGGQTNQNNPQAAPSAAANNDTQTTDKPAGQTAAPDALVKDLYKTHDKDNGKIMDGKSRVLLDKYFVKSTADLIWKDLTTHKDEVGVIDFDIFYNAQDTDIKNFAVGAPKIEGTKASVPVSFTNFKEKQNLTYSLVQQGDAWKISDIKYNEGTLLGYFKTETKTETKTTNAPARKGSEGDFDGTYQVGETTCTVKPIKMAFEVRWAKGSGTEVFVFEDRANDQYVYSSNDGNIFSLNEAQSAGEFIRADGKRLSVRKIK